MKKDELTRQDSQIDIKSVRKVKKTVAHPQRHFAVISQQGHIKDEASQELLQHGGPEVSAE